MNPKKKAHTSQVGQVIFPGAQILDITGPMEVFSQAKKLLSGAGSTGTPAYSLSLIAETRGPVIMSSGLQLVADRSIHDPDTRPDTLMVAGGSGVYKAASRPGLVRFIRDQAARVRRMASICTGTFLLAEAGLLDGRAATTHWSATRRLAETYPLVNVKPDKIFVKDGHVYSSAGVTAGIDLALALVQEDHGRDLALKIAKQLVVFMKRQGGQSQFSSSLARQAAAEGRLAKVLLWIKQNPEKDLSVDALACRAAMSQRNFARTFKQETGMTPGKFVEKMRVETAAHKIETLDSGFKEIARESGFKDEEMMRRAFKRQLHVLPHLYRKRFGYSMTYPD